MEIFKPVHVNIHLVGTIRQMFSYVKFHKDLCTKKKSIHVEKKVFLIKNISYVVKHKIPPKFKDPGSLLFHVVLGSRVAKSGSRFSLIDSEPGRHFLCLGPRLILGFFATGTESIKLEKIQVLNPDQ